MATLDDVYRKFGEVSEAAQLLETELGNVLIVLGIAGHDLLENPDPAKAVALFKGVNRKTLGQLRNNLHESTETADHLAEQLSSALTARNRLSHKFYRLHNFRRNTSSGCDIMLKDLESMHKTIMDAYKGVLLLSGIDLDKVTLESLPTEHVRI